MGTRFTAAEVGPLLDAAGMSELVKSKGGGKAGIMNNTEAAYASELEAMKAAGEVRWYGFEAFTLRLAKKTRYTPDFAVLLSDGSLMFVEVKGFWRDDARIKIKVAAEHYPFRFVAVTKRRKRDGGGWRMESF